MAVLPDHHVRGLHVAVHHALAVRVVERHGDGREDAHDIGFGDARCPCVFRKIVVEGLAVDVVHHEERVAVVLLEGANLHNVGMNEPHRDERLVLQLPVRPLVRHQDARQHLDRERLVVELRVLRQPHRTHPAAPQLAHYAVAVREERSLGVPRDRQRVVDGFGCQGLPLWLIGNSFCLSGNRCTFRPGRPSTASTSRTPSPRTSTGGRGSRPPRTPPPRTPRARRRRSSRT